MTTTQIIAQLRNLLNENPVYIWGANGEIVTPEMIQGLQNRFISGIHTHDYYEEKLTLWRGRKAVDEVGILNFLSGENWSLNQYISSAKQVFSAADMNADCVQVLIDTRLDGTPKVGVYLGDGTVISSSEFYGGMKEIPINREEWKHGFVPHFVEEDFPIKYASTAVMHYQAWLNEYASNHQLGTENVDGYYTETTKKLSCAVAKELYGEIIGIGLDPTPEITIEEIVRDVSKHPVHMEDFAYLLYIISVRMYVMNLFPEFYKIWGHAAVDVTSDFGFRYKVVQDKLKDYILHCRYLDSAEINLTLLRELFL